MRYIGLFLQDPLLVPWPVVVYLAEHLGIAEPSSVQYYTERKKTAYEHAWEIEQAFVYHSYDDPGWGRKFRTICERLGSLAYSVSVSSGAARSRSGRGLGGGEGVAAAS